MSNHDEVPSASTRPASPSSEADNRRMITGILVVLSLFYLGFMLVMFFASHASASEPGIHLSASAMFMTNSSQQGGQGPSGSTLLTMSELEYAGSWWAVGSFFMYDKQGSSETDLTLGPKLELRTGVFYIEGGWAPLTQRGFTDRSIAKQTGSSWLMGAGVRIGFSAQMFLQFSYKYRIQKITEQDSTQLSNAIIQRDGYPLFGVGIRF